MTVTSIQKKNPRVPRCFSTATTVDVEIDADDLHDDGWHHELECPAGHSVGTEDGYGAGRIKVTYRAAIEELHHEAHGPGPLTLCQSRPCSLLGIDQLRGVA